MEDNKRKALAAALDRLEKKHGKGSIMRMGDFIQQEPGGGELQVISTGSLST